MLAQIEDHELPEIESYSEHVARHRREGREQGRQEGRKEAREAQEALRRSILKILDRKFGHVPADVQERVDSLKSVDELDRWLTLVLEAESLEELK